MNTKGFFKIFAPPMVASLAMFLAGPVAAVEWNDGITAGELNTIEDQDREAFFDINQSGTLDEGDVFVGYVRVDNFLPSGADSDLQVYSVFTQQVSGFEDIGTDDGRIILFETTTTVGLRLEDITGDANTAGGLFAIYDQPVAYPDLITDPAGNGDDLKDLTDIIVNDGTLRLVGGLVSADNFFHTTAAAGFGEGASTFAMDQLTAGDTLGSFTGGLDILFNNTAFTYAANVSSFDAFGVQHFTQFGIGSGSIRGGSGDEREAVYGDGSGFGAFMQCMDADGNDTICGFESDADFFVNAQRVPEPGTLMLFGSGLLGLAFLRRRVKKI